MDLVCCFYIVRDIKLLITVINYCHHFKRTIIMVFSFGNLGKYWQDFFSNYWLNVCHASLRKFYPKKKIVKWNMMCQTVFQYENNCLNGQTLVVNIGWYAERVHTSMMNILLTEFLFQNGKLTINVRLLYNSATYTQGNFQALFSYYFSFFFLIKIDR